MTFNPLEMKSAKFLILNIQDHIKFIRIKSSNINCNDA